MTPNFEVFKRERRRWPSTPAVTITRRGVISLNRPAYTAMGEPEAVELLHDRGERIVGLRATPRETPHAYTVRPAGGDPSGPFVVQAKTFAMYCGLDLSESRRWLAAMDGDVLCVDLKLAGLRVTSNRASPQPVAPRRSGE